MGEKCIVGCVLQGKETQALWVAGAQVSIMISNNWQDTYLPWERVKGIEELLRVEQYLRFGELNGTVVPYLGWVQAQFKLSGLGEQGEHLEVPLLVGENDQELPVIGFNVIEELIHKNGGVLLIDCIVLILSSFSTIKKERVGVLVTH